MRIRLFAFIFQLTFHFTFSQSKNSNITIHSRVDTSKKEINEIAALWANYLNSEPDSVYDNPYWNEAEKNRFKDFDLSRLFIYQFSSKQLLNYYKPTILSIEKEADNYAIRTLFAADGLEGIYKKSNPWCITKLYAVRENNKWKLKNALSVLTQEWKRKTVGKITFIYPPSHKFNDTLAKKANEFCIRIVKDFQFPEYKPFDFYITNSGDAMGQLFNFDFYFAGYTTGVGMNEIRMLFSGIGSEWYPHELVHMIVPDKKRHRMINEGFATWQAGAGDKKTFDELVKILAIELSKNNTIKFNDVLNLKWGWQCNAFYTTGALFCKLAIEKKGISGLKMLLEIPQDNDKLVDTICTLFGVSKADFDKFWRTETLRYLRN